MIQPIHDVPQIQFLIQTFPVFRHNTVTDIIIFCFRIGHAFRHILAGNHEIVSVADITQVLGKPFRLHILHQPEGAVRFPQRFDDRLPDSHGRFPAPAFIRDVGNKDIINSAIGFRVRVMTVIVHPAHRPVFADDAVLHVIQLVFTVCNLLYDGIRDGAIVVRMQHAFKCVSCQFLKLIQIPAPEDIKHGLVGIQQFFRQFRLIDKEPAGHMPADLFHNMNRLLVQLKVFPKQFHNLPVCKELTAIPGSLKIHLKQLYNRGTTIYNRGAINAAAKARPCTVQTK